MLKRLVSLFARVRGQAGRSFFGEFLSFGSSTAFVQATRLGSALLVAGILGPEAWGRWYLLNLVIAYGSLTQLGALNGMNREVPAALGHGDEELALDLRRVALGVVLLTIGCATFLLIALGVVVPSIPLSSEFLLTILLLFANQIHTYVSASLRSTTNFAKLSRLQYVQTVVHPVLAILGASFLGLVGFILGQTLALAIIGLIASNSQDVTWRPRVERSLGRKLIGVGFPIMLVGLVHTLFATVDRWVVVGHLGSQALGHYSLAIMALSAVALLPQVISQQFYPRLAFTWSAAEDTEDLRRLATRQRLYTFGAVVPVVAVVALAAPLLVREYLPQYASGVNAMRILIMTPLVATVGEGFGSILHVLGRQYWYIGALLASALVNVACSLALVGPFGLTGVAVGTLTAFAVLAVSRVVLGGMALRLAARARV